MQQNTVFISYRRVMSKHLARSIYIHLQVHGWDVFLDVNTIDSGDFDRIILNQIGARAHFILLISAGALERCAQANDWVLREIQEAVRLERNIVPIVEEGADFQRELAYLPVEIRDAISKKNALPLPHFFFDAALEMLRTRFLKAPEYIPVQEISAIERHEVQRRLLNMENAPAFDEAVSLAQVFKGKRNQDWHPFTTTFPDLPIPETSFCLVPVGAFTMGGGEFSIEHPAHVQQIKSPYWIGQYPITNAEWRQAVNLGVVSEPHHVGDALTWYHDPQFARAPVVGIDASMAKSFAAWMGCQLPSEVEWEYAVRGVESWLYAWGNDWTPSKSIYLVNSGNKPALITTKPEGKSWVGAWHMIGNVWEWTRSRYEPYPYHAQDGREQDQNMGNAHRILRGGSFGLSGEEMMRASFRYDESPASYDLNWGLRLVRPFA